MDAASFRASLTSPQPPAELDQLLLALWYAWNGRWHESHDVVNDCSGTDGAWLHAHLHREEGDLGNADYWYRKAGRPRPDQPLEDEREAMLAAWANN